MKELILNVAEPIIAGDRGYSNSIKKQSKEMKEYLSKHPDAEIKKYNAFVMINNICFNLPKQVYTKLLQTV